MCELENNKNENNSFSNIKEEDRRREFDALKSKTFEDKIRERKRKDE